jgi:hypothetical protein
MYVVRPQSHALVRTRDSADRPWQPTNPAVSYSFVASAWGSLQIRAHPYARAVRERSVADPIRRLRGSGLCRRSAADAGSSCRAEGGRARTPSGRHAELVGHQRRDLHREAFGHRFVLDPDRVDHLVRDGVERPAGDGESAQKRHVRCRAVSSRRSARQSRDPVRKRGSYISRPRRSSTSYRASRRSNAGLVPSSTSTTR